MFTLVGEDPGSRARRGRLTTAHGVIETPAFMPVGTQGSVKAVSPRELRELQSQIILGNTYHLFVRPGLEVIRHFGGLHRFMNWDGPILTDSGGYQIFSLAKLRKITDDGVRFQNHLDGTPTFISPEIAMEIQVTLGSDIAMVLDECPPWPCEHEYAARSLEMTIRWARRCREASLLEANVERRTSNAERRTAEEEENVQRSTSNVQRPTQQLVFGIVQGATFADLRRASAEATVQIGFDGYAIGGVSVGEPEAEMMAAVENSEPYLPADKPRYCMGLGTPPQMIELIARGVDMFDCVLPTRLARNGTAFTAAGTLNLKNAEFTLDARPIEEGCACPACSEFTRGYIRHLVKAEEILGLRLITLHNLHFYLTLMTRTRSAIEDGTFAEFRRSFVANYRARSMADEAARQPRHFSMSATTSLTNDRLRFVWAAVLVVAVAVSVLLRVRLLELPLERDEGEYAYAGQLLLQGIPPYQLAYNMKFPGTYAAYALLMGIFGQTIAGVHLGLLVVNAATIALVCLLGRKLVNFTAGAAAAACYAVLSISPSLLGFAGHATHFVVLPVLGGTLLLVGSARSHLAIAASGMLFGIGVLMKQPAVFFGLFGVAFLFYRDAHDRLPLGRRLQRVALFAGGAVVPFALTSFLLWRAGVFDKFWFWTIDYARAYGTLVSVADGANFLAATMRGILRAGWPVWLLAALGLSACFWSADLRRRTLFFFLTFLVCAALAVCPGLYFRQHYFLLLLPVICLLAGVAVATAGMLVARFGRAAQLLPVFIVLAACAWPLVVDRAFFLAADPATASRMVYGTNPFPESVRIGEYLRTHADPSDKIAVLGSEPQIYFYARRQSATGYIYTYALMEEHAYAERMQREMIAELEAARPKYLVVVRVASSWAARSDTGNLIFDWFGDYGLRNYRIAGLANTHPSGRSDYHFPADLRTIELSDSYVLVYERNP